MEFYNDIRHSIIHRKFFERNSFLFQGITRELHRDVKLSKILN